MSNIVVEPQPEKVPTTSQESQKPAEPVKPVDPLAALIVPADLADVDPTYRGKSARDIIEMHQNATRKIGEQANENGVWRKLVSQLSTAQTSSPSAKEPTAKPVEITNDELLGNPTKAISDVVQSELKVALDPIKEQLSIHAVRTEFGELAKEFPKMVETGNDPEFKSWIEKSKARSADAGAVQRGDAMAARRLLEAWEERQQLIAAHKPAQTTTTTTVPVTTTPRQEGIEAARRAVTETGGHGSAPVQDAMSAASIVDTIIKNPELYRSEAYQEKLKAAAKAGKISF